MKAVARARTAVAVGRSPCRRRAAKKKKKKKCKKQKKVNQRVPANRHIGIAAVAGCPRTARCRRTPDEHPAYRWRGSSDVAARASAEGASRPQSVQNRPARLQTRFASMPATGSRAHVRRAQARAVPRKNRRMPYAEPYVAHADGR